MSYWVYLEDDQGRTFNSAQRIAAGGTYVLGGTTETSLNITYNYGKAYTLVPFTLRDLDGKYAEACIEILTRAVGFLGTQQDKDYWAPTPGNAGFALSILLEWAKEFPTGRFRVS